VAAAAVAVAAGLALAVAGSPVPIALTPATSPTPTVARNVIFIQGDGMGDAQWAFLRLASVGPGGLLAMDRLPVTGSVRTDPDDPDESVTDSAAAATAFATGVKTHNGAVGVDPAGRTLSTALELAQRSGRATGLVTTATVTDATPASFAAHVGSRDDQSEIARQYLELSRPDVILGGGEDYWHPAGDPGAHPDHPAKDPAEASVGTRGRLVDRARELGYDYVTDAAGLAASTSGRLLGLFANEELYEARKDGQGGSYSPAVPLPTMTRKALDVLDDDPEGFFLVIEEEGVDAMAHQNNTGLLLESLRALDAAVAVALEFQQAHPDTLVLVVGDHETGGMSIVDSAASGDDDELDGPLASAGGAGSFYVRWATANHTGVETPLTAGGPGAGALAGSIDNTDVFGAMVSAMGLSGR